VQRHLAQQPAQHRQARKEAGHPCECVRARVCVLVCWCVGVLVCGGGSGVSLRKPACKAQAPPYHDSTSHTQRATLSAPDTHTHTHSSSTHARTRTHPEAARPAPGSRGSPPRRPWRRRAAAAASTRRGSAPGCPVCRCVRVAVWWCASGCVPLWCGVLLKPRSARLLLLAAIGPCADEARTHTHTHTHARTHTHTHRHTHTHTHARTHARTHTHTRTHTSVCHAPSAAG
jgi:hypothetical protein